MEALQGTRGAKLALTVRPYPETSTKEVPVAFNSAGSLAMDARPNKAIAELEKAIWYVDLSRLQDKEVDDAVKDLTTAKGIVFDMRGYPRVSPAWFSHVTRTPLRS